MAPSLNFLDFPKEIRLAVYAVLKDFATEHREANQPATRYLSNGASGERFCDSLDFERTRKSLRLTCKQINEEWTPLFLRSTTICIDQWRSPQRFSETFVSSGKGAMVTDMRHVELRTQVKKLRYCRLRRHRCISIICSHSKIILTRLIILLCQHKVVFKPEQLKVVLYRGNCTALRGCPPLNKHNQHDRREKFDLNTFIALSLAVPFAGRVCKVSMTDNNNFLELVFKDPIMTTLASREGDSCISDSNKYEIEAVAAATAEIEEQNGAQVLSSAHAKGQKRTSSPDADPDTSEAEPKRLKLDWFR